MATRKYLAADGTVFDTAKEADEYDARQPHLDSVVGFLNMGQDQAATAHFILEHFEQNFRVPAKRGPRKVKITTPTEAGVIADTRLDKKGKSNGTANPTT